MSETLTHKHELNKEKLFFIPSSVGLTSKDIPVVVKFPTGSVKHEIRVNGTEWRKYLAAVIFTSNGTLEARAFNEAGELLTSDTLRISTIDRNLPEEMEGYVEEIETLNVSEEREEESVAHVAVEKPVSEAAGTTRIAIVSFHTPEPIALGVPP